MMDFFSQKFPYETDNFEKFDQDLGMKNNMFDYCKEIEEFHGIKRIPIQFYSN